MKDQLRSSYEEDVSKCHWWRSSNTFKECSKLKGENTPSINLSKITPKIKVLREMERIALVAEEAGVDEIKHKLYNYRSGDFWVPIGGIKKEDLDIPPVNTILLVGFHNAGKSSVVNLMYSVLGRCGIMPFAQTSSGNATNLFLEEHNVLRSTRSGFCVYDARGFNYDEVNYFIEELSNWLTDGVHHKQLCLSPVDDETVKEEMLENNMWNSFSKFARRRVNSVMMVVNSSEVYKGLKDGDKKPLEAIKELFYSPPLRRCIENPILILTHGDKLSTEERIESRLKICEYLGVSETIGVYDIVCFTEYRFVADECDPIMVYALIEAVYRALLTSDRTHLPKKKFCDWALLLLWWLLYFLGAIFAFLGHVFSRLGGRRKI